MNGQTDSRKMRFCNLHLCRELEYCGEFGFPMVKQYVGEVPKSFLPFNISLSSREYGSGVHFFIDDYQFERVWRMPERYLPLLSRFRCVVAPDFSLFVDVPDVVNLWNIYRNRLIASWLQCNGVNLLPSVSWGNRDSFRYCFEGLPDNSIIVVGHTSVGRDVRYSQLWHQGIRELVKRKSPRKLVIYGKPCNVDFDDVVFIDDYISKLKRV